MPMEFNCLLRLVTPGSTQLSSYCVDSDTWRAACLQAVSALVSRLEQTESAQTLLRSHATGKMVPTSYWKLVAEARALRLVSSN